jgi:hypothetical protein
MGDESIEDEKHLTDGDRRMDRAHVRGSVGILLTVTFAVMGFFITNRSIQCDLIQHRTVDTSLVIQAGDSCVSLHAHSHLLMDSLGIRLKRQACSKIENKCDAVIYHENSSFMIWLILICTLVGLTAGSVPFLSFQIWSLIVQFWRDIKLPFAIVGGLLFSTVMGFSIYGILDSNAGFFPPPDVMKYFGILLEDPTLLDRIVGIILALLLPALFLFFLIALCSDKIFRRARWGVRSSTENTKQSIERGVRRLKNLNSSLEVNLQILATVICISVLCAHMLGQSVKAAVTVDGFDIYPERSSFVYGFYFTFFLAVIYIPIYQCLKLNYLRLRDIAANLDATEADPTWHEKLFGELKFEGSVADKIRLSLAIATPLITSLLPRTFDFLK